MPTIAPIAVSFLASGVENVCAELLGYLYLGMLSIYKCVLNFHYLFLSAVADEEARIHTEGISDRKGTEPFQKGRTKR